MSNLPDSFSFTFTKQQLIALLCLTGIGAAHMMEATAEAPEEREEASRAIKDSNQLLLVLQAVPLGVVKGLSEVLMASYNSQISGFDDA